MINTKNMDTRNADTRNTDTRNDLLLHAVQSQSQAYLRGRYSWISSRGVVQALQRRQAKESRFEGFIGRLFAYLGW